MEIIVVRHGLTETNKKGIVNGRLDELLTDEGRAQAEDLAERLESKGIESIYSSPLKRASLTALPIAKKIGKSINIDHRLIEVDFGSFEGRPNSEMEKELGVQARELLDKYQYDLTPFGGESSEEVESRVKSFVDDLRKQNYEKVLIVTHGGIVRWLHYIATGKKIGPSPNAEELDLII